MDVERVEVLRGPQSTLFGQNASAGVISVTTRKPQFTTQGKVEIGFGEQNQKLASGYLTGPISDTLAFRLYAGRRVRDGFMTIDTGDGPRPEVDDNNQDFGTVRGQLLWLPSDNVSFRLIGDFSRRDEYCCIGTQIRTANTYPFIDGLFDASLFPVAEWREASRQALSVRDIGQWSMDGGDADDPMLIEEIRTKVLPRRGIQARPDEILITVGAQQALSLVSRMLIDRTSVVAIENPGYPDMRRLAMDRGARLVHQPVDDEGLVVDRRLDDCDLVYVTPSHQFPTGVMMTQARREALLRKAAARDLVIIEDDFACETNYLDEACPALRSLDRDDRVIYVAGFSKVLGPGLRLGFMVASAEVIAEARRLRHLSIRHPPLNNQRAAAHFLAMGHYDATMMRLGRLFRERRTALRDALNHYLQQSVAIAPLRGGATYWVRGPDHLDVEEFAAEAERRGVLIEPVGPYYADSKAPRSIFRLGVTSLPLDRIRQGVAALADLMRDLPGTADAFPETASARLSGEALRTAMSGATLLCKTVYGDPCTIELLPDGQMVGRAGYANEDCDEGRWWVEGDFWCRQWNRWSYGETSSLMTTIVGDRIGWFDAGGRLVDSAVIRRADTV
jgi:GntR family transcriptional regulator/MocR family aminotransferase